MEFIRDFLVVNLCCLGALVVSKILEFSLLETMLVVIMFCAFGGALMGILDYYKCNKIKKE